MKRIKEQFLDTLEDQVPLKGLSVLEIGCGNGSRSVAIASRCKEFTGIDPDSSQLDQAILRKIPNAIFRTAMAENLYLPNYSFDVVIFALSLHHVPVHHMDLAIDEAIRVVRPKGYIVFLEPTEEGSFFEAELQFDASDGDERAEKKAAYAAMLNHPGIKSIAEIDDETIFQLNSVDDFVQSFSAKKNLNDVQSFLEAHNFILSAKRRINIYQPILG